MTIAGGQCEVLAGVFSIAVQGILFALCVCILVGKKLLDPSRSWRDFLMDSSKQFVGAGWIHVMNLFCATTMEARLREGDQCEWYWINIVVDCTLGVLVEYLALTMLTMLVVKLSGADSVEDSDFASGDYRDPETQDISPVRYWKQLSLWLACVTIMKFSMVSLMISFHEHFQLLASCILSPTQEDPRLKLLVVMIVTPFFMNALQFLLVDSFIRKDDDHCGFEKAFSEESHPFDVELSS